MGKSLRDVALELSRLTGSKLTRDLVRHFETGHSPIPEHARVAYGTMLANHISRSMGREVAVTLAINSPWRITPFVACVRCGRWFELKTDKSKHCHACARR
jgi:hypothetical protein